MASELIAVLRTALADLGRAGADSALVGGLAVSLRTRPRTTKDVDLAVAVADDHEAERLVGQLLRRGYRPAAILEHEVTGRLTTARLYLPRSDATGPDLDLLFISCGIESEIVHAATVETLGDLESVRVARVGHLIAMKVLAEGEHREHDRADLRALAASRADRNASSPVKPCFASGSSATDAARI